MTAAPRIEPTAGRRTPGTGDPPRHPATEGWDDMGIWRRRLRAAFGMGLIWGTAWFLAGMVLLLIIGPDAADVPFPLFFGFLGFLAGGLFSAVFALVERHRRLDQMSLGRFAAWGGIGGLLLGAVFALVGGVELLGVAPVLAVAGGCSAAGALAIARRGAAPAPLEGDTSAAELPPGGAE